MKKIAIYMRVSTTLQNFEIQENDLLNYAKARQFTIFKIYKDMASGTKDSRPELNQLMNDARKRKFDVVICWRLDRFSRSTKSLILALEEFNSIGIDFISYQENIQTDTPTGRALFTMISAVAQLERDIIRERVISGLKNAKLRGKQLGRPKSRKDAEIKKLRAKSMSYRAIAKELNTSIASVHRALKSTSSHD